MPGAQRHNGVLPGALDHADTIVRRLREGQGVVFLDYDGTLTPIVARPELATMGAGMRTAVAALAARMPVGVISGRAVDDVRARVGVAGIYYAGNHGLEVVGPAGSGVHAVRGEAYAADMAAACRRLCEALADMAGVIVEDKRLTVSVHYRLAAEADLPRIEAAVDAALADLPRLTRRPGKKVIEIRPRMDWHKGRVVDWLLDLLALERPVPVYIGDDVTDEDAFRAVAAGGVGIRVGDARADSAARYQLRDTAQVQRFVEVLAAPAGAGR